MKKKLLLSFITGIALVGMVGIANATLTTIGTATYLGSDYNLILDDNNNGNSLVWLDYTTPEMSWWGVQTEWAASLDEQLTNINTPGYSISWNDSEWRLPSAGSDPQWGYGQITSEMGHLWYNEFRFTAEENPSTFELNEASEFDNLIASSYWSTEWQHNPGSAWYFSMSSGNQAHSHKDWSDYGLAVRGGNVSAVPIPGAVYLLGSGLVGLASIRKRRQKVKRGQIYLIPRHQ